MESCQREDLEKSRSEVADRLTRINATHAARDGLYRQPGKLEIQEREFSRLQDPKGPKIEHAVILELVTTNICGSDLHIYHGRFAAPQGMQLGHENTAEVTFLRTRAITHSRGTIFMLESPATDLADILGQLREASRCTYNGTADSGPVPKPTKTAAARNRDGALLPWRALRILAHIEKNLYRQVRSCELAKVVGLSDSRFSKTFRIRFGVSVHAYVTFRRIEVSRHLMLTTQAPLSEIALSCGMSDQAHFTKVFKRVVGQPPSRWRKSQQNDRSDSLDSSERLRCLIELE